MYWIASVYGAMSDEPNALIWLQRSADQHEIQVLFANVDPIFAPMRHSPGFRALLKNLGLDR
jgi:hypothetical protein